MVVVLGVLWEVRYVLDKLRCCAEVIRYVSGHFRSGYAECYAVLSTLVLRGGVPVCE
jgi:hypothetical protein